ncbi:A24 family peptidase [Streptomyces sp. GMY02]|uniref:prepilin peptidase n=1 Tax=Streptomyces sp. GMY02 TaxID=1333528 RepID=UPI001C2BE4B1|nr:A24 family peptidase [Streptomyces sp. GMY02]QXE34941.1 A24 family peptidase [Streptomyces sp. GMY02]
MYATLIVVAVLWGGTTGLLLPRAVYRLSVAPEESWRADCPAGHPITGPARGWLGGTRCASCEAGVPARTAAAPAPASTTEAEARADDRGATARTDTSADIVTNTTGPATGGAPASAVRYAPSVLLPLLTALACAALAAATGPRPELAVWLLLTPFAMVLALVDRHVHRLPDQLTLPLAAAAAVLLGAAALLPGAGGSWTDALLGGLALGACYFLLFLINPNGMGFGDVKLALSLGVALGWYGWPVLFVGAFAGFLLGAVYGLGLVLLRRASRKSAIPFGPFMITGALIGLLLGGLAAA